MEQNEADKARRYIETTRALKLLALPSTMQEVTVANLPGAALWIMAVALIIFAVSSLLIAFAIVSVLGSVTTLVNELHDATRKANERLPGLMDSFERRL